MPTLSVVAVAAGVAVSVAVRDLLYILWTESATRVCGTTFLEIWVHASLLSAEATRRVVHEHHLEQIKAVWVEVGAKWDVDIANPFREGGFEVGERGHTLPVVFGRCAQEPWKMLA